MPGMIDERCVMREKAMLKKGIEYITNYEGGYEDMMTKKGNWIYKVIMMCMFAVVVLCMCPSVKVEAV